MADNILTPEFRGAFVQVFKATGMKGQPDAAKKYSVRAAFLPGTDLSEMKKQAQLAASEKWGNAIPKTMRSPFRKNEELDTPVAGIPDDAIVMTFSASEDRRPGVVDAKLQDIIDDAECYSGAWYRAQVRAFAYDTSGNKGVSFGLQNLQKLREGEPLGGRLPASKAFTAVESPAGSADALFD
ncbi:MAG TPA: ssDNA-binding protein [Rhizobacter sp.]|nr:ssDNA-binding protein [Rhizobacter sp.]